MNVIAGLLIGLVNDTWLTKVFTCFGWGISFCIYQYVLGNAKESVLRHKYTKNATLKFYIVEYLTAVTTSLIFSVISGVIKSVFYR